MKAIFLVEFARAAKQGPRLFFALLIGAIKGAQDEVHRIEELARMPAPPARLREAAMAARAQKAVMQGASSLTAEPVRILV
jgi:hypothetical protein